MKGLSKNVVFLGIVSGLTDISSEMLYPVVPIFLTSVLHAPMTVVGFIEGAAEATASLLKMAGGWWSDRVSKRKPFVVFGYGLSALSKPILALALTWHWVLFSRFLDRVGKGVRTSARDALLSSSAGQEHWGLAFGFHRAMDTAGAALGPLIAVFLLSVLHWGYRAVFVGAFVPAALGVLVLALFVREKSVGIPRPIPGMNLSLNQLEGLSSNFKRFTLFYGIFALGNSSDVFLLMKAKQIGFSTTHMILAYVGYNIVYALCATPAGWISDRLGRIRTLVFGLLVFAVVYLGFAVTFSKAALWVLFAVYGFYGAFTEGVAKASIADLSGSQNRATAMGIFQGTMGILAFFASVLAGWLWTHVSSSVPFFVGSACAGLSCIFLTVWNRGK